MNVAMANPDLDEIEEQARQFTSAQQRTRTKRRLQTPTVESTIPSDLKTGRSFSEDDLVQLIEGSFPDPVISFYLSLTPEKMVPQKKEYLAAFHSLKHRALEDSADLIQMLTPGQRQQLDQDLAEIETFLREDFDSSGVRGLAIFVSNNRLRRAFALPVYLRDLLVIDPNPYTSPLAEILEEYPPVLVASIQRGKADFSLYRLGRWTKLASIKELVSKAKTDAGKPGKAQRLYESQLDTFLKEINIRLEELLLSRIFQRLILTGDEGTLGQLNGLFSDKLGQTLLDKWGDDPEESEKSLTEKVEGALKSLKDKLEQTAVSDLGEFQNKEELSIGLSAVIGAQNRSIVRHLYLSENLIKPGFVCRRHQFLSMMAGVCEFCHRPLWPVRNITDSLAEAAARQQTPIIFFRQEPQLLDAYGGVAAVIYPQNV